MKIFTIISCLILISFSSCFDYNDQRIPKLDALFEKWNKPGTPGVSVGIIENNKLVYHKNFGLSDLHNNLPVEKNTKFLIGSVSKQFTCLVIALLEEQRRINVNDVVSKYLPNMSPLFDLITVDQLMKHTSGLRDYLTLAILKGEDARYFGFSRNYVVEELLMKQRTLNFNPQTEWMYSNSGYVILELLVERVTGKPYIQVLKELVFDPLGMKDSTIAPIAGTIIKNAARGYVPSGVLGQFLESPLIAENIAGAGGIFTTIEDFLKYDDNFYNNKLGNSGNDLIRKLITPGRYLNGTAHQYGYGLVITPTPLGRMIHHTGSFPGFLTAFSRFPDRKTTFLIFSTGNDFEAVMNEAKIVSIWFGLSEKNQFDLEWKLRENIYNEGIQADKLNNLLFSKFIPQSKTQNSFNVDKFVGYYYSRELDITYNIVKETNNVLSFRVKSSDKIYLVMKSSNDFWINGEASMHGTFVERNGRVSSMVFNIPRASFITYERVERSPIC